MRSNPAFRSILISNHFSQQPWTLVISTFSRYLQNCHIPYLTSKPFKSNSDVFGLTFDLCSDVTSTLLLLTPFVAMQLPLLFLSISTSPIVPCSPIVPYCL